jgi:hypothetical protein
VPAKPAVPEQAGSTPVNEIPSSFQVPASAFGLAIAPLCLTAALLHITSSCADAVGTDLPHPLRPEFSFSPGSGRWPKPSMIWPPDGSAAFPAHALRPLGLHPLVADMTHTAGCGRSRRWLCSAKITVPKSSLAIAT